MFNNTVHRPATIRRIRLGADEDGRITAIGTRALYAGVNRMTRRHLVVLDMAEGDAMGAPGEASDGKTLWAGEFALGSLYRLALKDATTLTSVGATTAHHFTGPAPDSMQTDAPARLYVALYGQGRILVFAPTGLPIAQILLLGRDEDRNPDLASMTIRSGTDAMVIVARDGFRGGHATVFHARTTAR